MNDCTPKAWMAFALVLSLLLLQGCGTTAPYYYQDADCDEERVWPDGFYYRAQNLLASLTDEQRAVFEREKEAVEVIGEPASKLFAEAYRQGYREGYAYGKATRYKHGRYSIGRKTGDYSWYVVHFLGSSERAPSHVVFPCQSGNHRSENSLPL